jgi:hypothetical protein
MKEWAPTEVEFYKKKYVSASKGNYDIYVVFVEKGLDIINHFGKLGFILPSKFFTTDYGLNLRDIISQKSVLSKIVDFGAHQIFNQATTYTNLLFLSGTTQKTFKYTKVEDLSDLNKNQFYDIEQFKKGELWSFGNKKAKDIIDKLIMSSRRLGEFSRIGRGSSSGNDKVFIIKRDGDGFISTDGNQFEIEQEILRYPIYATNFSRYKFYPKYDEAIIFPYLVERDGYTLIVENEIKNKFPFAFKYLASHKKILEKRKQFKTWYSFSAPRNLEVHDNAHFIVPLLANKGSFSFIENNRKFCLMASGGFSITIDNSLNLSPFYVLGILNSKLLFWNLKSISNVFRGGWITCTKQYVETLPIHLIDFTNPREVEQHDRMVALVERMLELHKRHPQTPQETDRLQREIAATDGAIDKLVYELYGLTEEEVRIVEGGS